MQCFRRIDLRLDIGRLRAEIESCLFPWLGTAGKHPGLAVLDSGQGDVVRLRIPERSRIMGRRRRDVHETSYADRAARFPETIRCLGLLAKTLDGQLGRAKLARLPPGARLPPRADLGAYYRQRDRYHLVLNSTGGSALTAGGQSVRMQPGELWWFDNKTLHSAHNESDTPRIHLVFDLLSSGLDSYAGSSKPAPRELLERFQRSPSASPVDAVADAVALYQAICRNPADWHQVLRANSLGAIADRLPLRALAKLMWPELSIDRRRRRESVLAWSLAQLDLDRVTPEQVTSAIESTGGIRAIHAAWQEERTSTPSS